MKGESMKTTISLRYILATIGLLLFPTIALSVGFDHSHAQWTGVLKQYLSENNLFDYKQLKADTEQKNAPVFENYLSSLQKVPKSDYDSWTKNDQKAFLINAYNAFTVKLIVDNYPVKSIKDIGGFLTKPWDVEFFSLLGGVIKSINPIEHDYLRPKFKDYRIHAAVNCASISCPPLRRDAFDGKLLDGQLDEQMRIWLLDRSRNRFDAITGEVHISKIFDWYESDFEKWGGGVKTVLLKHGDEQVKKAVKTSKKFPYLDYDWNLNEAKSAPEGTW
jgi:hypothetical protein